MVNRKFLRYIQDAKNVLVLSSNRLDFDALGSGLIIKKYLESLKKDVRFVFPADVTEKEKAYYAFLPYFDEIEFVDSRKVIKDGTFDMLVLVDGSSWKIFYDSNQGLANPPDFASFTKIAQFDHHLLPSQNIGHFTIRKNEASSAAEVILLNVIPKEFINKNIATLGYAAVVGDTGNFRWNFYPSTLNLCAELIKKGAGYLEISEKFNFSRSEEYLKMYSFILNKMTYDNRTSSSFLYLPNRVLKEAKIDESRLEMIKSILELELARAVKGYPRTFTIYEENPGIVSVSCRGSSFYNKINLAEMLREVSENAGGHFNSCGLKVEGNFEDIKDRLIETLKRHLS